MKKIRKNAAIVLSLLLAFTFSGCGEALVNLTDEEAESIVAYSAHVISKYNKRQPDGVVRVFMTEEETKEEEPEPPESEAGETESEAPEASDEELSGGESSPEQEEPTIPTVDLSSFIGRPDLSINWTNTLLTQNYISNDAMSVSSGADEAYVVLTMEITNPGTEDTELNMLELNCDFKLWINGSKRIPFAITILPSDFPTFTGVIPAGQTVKSEVFFKRTLDEISEEDLYALEVVYNGESGIVEKQE